MGVLAGRNWHVVPRLRETGELPALPSSEVRMCWAGSTGRDVGRVDGEERDRASVGERYVIAGGGALVAGTGQSCGGAGHAVDAIERCRGGRAQAGARRLASEPVQRCDQPQRPPRQASRIAWQRRPTPQRRRPSNEGSVASNRTC